ncbi:hypothetical protein M0R89_00755 [Halorussus limi]|uniref:Uncharacterized protein n=1 Tax=Halorussus limi TaxID=2938695 RepID=A0A8U0HVH3_9EURY|nr:hypothetical protein [Halorussus limi]UPV74614.1 hypothetical protein M0R89_00755 [Halorussus limi]
MSKVYPYRLADFLHEQVGDGLRSVIYHDRDEYEVVFVREDLEDYDGEEIDDIVADLWADSYEQAIREDLRGHGPLNCTVWVFEDAIEMHFVADDRRGIAVALDTETFLAQSSFIGQCLGVAGLK